MCVFGIHMKQARVKMSDRTNQILNIVKAKYNLKDKSAAIELVVAIVTILNNATFCV
jgi:hypothetical protein